MTFFVPKYGDSTHHERMREKGKRALFIMMRCPFLSFSLPVPSIENVMQSAAAAMGTYRKDRLEGDLIS